MSTNERPSKCEFLESGRRLVLRDPYLAPTADSFLWNRRMMLQVSCRGYAWAQALQPDSTVYAYPASLLAKTFMQPEPRYFAHHPGRFFYVRDEAAGTIFSAPHDPVRAVPDEFEFAPGVDDIAWRVAKDGWAVGLRVFLPLDETVECWTVTLTNEAQRRRAASLFPYFPVGYASWMNMAGQYDESLLAAVCPYVTPYQALADYYKNQSLKEITFLSADVAPDSWELNQPRFEGEGGLNQPSALTRPWLARGEARFESPACAFQYRRELSPGESFTVQLLFGPAKDRREIGRLRRKLLGADKPERSLATVQRHNRQRAGCARVDSPDPWFNDFVNVWLPRQIDYLSEANRLTTDPQTRNYLQDAMGATYLDPDRARAMILAALGQQQASGRMPDGVLLAPEAKLKYINTVPHSDHCAWLPMVIAAFVRETGDYALLDEVVPFADRKQGASVDRHVRLALAWLMKDRTPRGLSRIWQGDWNDPMNMVGPRGIGESAMLSQSLAYGLNLWAEIAAERGDARAARRLAADAEQLNERINAHYWDGCWYARGRTDDGKNIGVRACREGKIFLNSQTFALLGGAAEGPRAEACIRAVEENLESGYGPMIVGPAFTRMCEDVGRMTQKHPGSDVNGSVYSHAVAFYVFALYAAGRGELAYRHLRHLLPGPEEDAIRQSEQLPCYLPNYYRGNQFPAKARYSSHMPHSGGANWIYRAIVEQLFGLRGTQQGLLIQPQLPASWPEARVARTFRGAQFEVHYRRDPRVARCTVRLNGTELPEALVRHPEPGQTHRVEVVLPG